MKGNENLYAYDFQFDLKLISAFIKAHKIQILVYSKQLLPFLR